MRINKCFLALAILLALRMPDVQGQTQRPVFYTAVRGHGGFIIIHSEDVGSLANSHPLGLEVDLGWQRRSDAAWAQCLCMPRVGIATSYWYFDKPDILGFGLTTMAYLEPVFGAWHRVSFGLRAGFGFSFQNRPYHPDDNPLNQSYSTYVAFPLQLGVKTGIRLSPQWSMDLTAVYNHISNGGTREPNKGINWPTAGLGITRFMEPFQPQRRPRTDWRSETAPQKRLEIGLFVAYNQPESKFFVFGPGAVLQYSHQVARISAVTAGAEWLYDNALRFRMEQFGITGSPHHFSLAAGHEFLLGKFIFNQQFGVYLKKPEARRNHVYQRYGLMYRLSPRIQAGVNIKVHGHVANFIDFRVACRLR